MSSKEFKNKFVDESNVNENDIPEEWKDSHTSNKEKLPAGGYSDWSKISQLRVPWDKVAGVNGTEQRPLIWPIEKITCGAKATFALVQEAKSYMAHRILKMSAKNNQYGIYDYVGCLRHTVEKGIWKNTKQPCPFCDILASNPDNPPKKLQVLGVIEISNTEYTCKNTKTSFPYGVPHVMFLDDKIVFQEILAAIAVANHEKKSWRGLIFNTQRADQKISPRLGSWRYCEKIVLPIKLDPKSGCIYIEDKEIPKTKIYKLVDFDNVLPILNGKSDYDGLFPVAEHNNIIKKLIDKHLSLAKMYIKEGFKFNKDAYKQHFGVNYIEEDIDEAGDFPADKEFENLMDETPEEKAATKIELKNVEIINTTPQETKITPEKVVEKKPGIYNPVTGKPIESTPAAFSPSNADELKEMSLKYNDFEIFADEHGNALADCSEDEINDIYRYFIERKAAKGGKGGKKLE